MADPQLENGFTRIATELLTALSKANLSGPEFMVCLAVITKTYGWNKKEDKISLTQFQQITLMTKTRIIRAIKHLVRSGVLGSITGDTRTCSTYWIIKDYDKWHVQPSITRDTTPPSITRDTTPSIIRDKKLVSQVIPTINNIQKTVIDIPAQPVPSGPTKVKYLSFVLLLPDEFKKLQQRFGNDDTEKYIYRLNNYIGSTGKRYKSHYHTILNWADMDARKAGASLV